MTTTKSSKAGTAEPAAKAPGEKAPKKPHGNAKRAWKVTRVKAWARWCRFEAEDLINGTSRLVLPAGTSMNHLRDYLLRRLKNPLIKDDPVDDEVLTRSLPAKGDQQAAPAGERRHVTLNAMNGLLESQSGTAWHKYERGSVGELDGLTVRKIDGWIPGAKAFYEVGPHGVPIWALMGGVLTVDDVWLPLLHYREGGSEAHRRTADALELDVLPVGNAADPDGRPAVPRAVAEKPVKDRTPEDWRIIDQAMTESLRVGARLLSGYTPEQFRRAIEVGYDLRGPEEDGFMIGDVLLLAIAALIHSGAHSTDDHTWNHPETGWLEDDVFTALRARRPLFDAYGAAFFFEDEIGAWLDAMQAAYLVRNGYAGAPSAADIDAKRAAYARLVEEEAEAEAATQPSGDLRTQALKNRRKPSVVRLD
jgi:hypothetical protein